MHKLRIRHVVLPAVTDLATLFRLTCISPIADSSPDLKKPEPKSLGTFVKCAKQKSHTNAQHI